MNKFFIRQDNLSLSIMLKAVCFLMKAAFILLFIEMGRNTREIQTIRVQLYGCANATNQQTTPRFLQS